MHLPLSLAVAPDLVLLPEIDSTNDELQRRADAPDFTVVATTSQTAGRGRLGRVWIAPPGRTLAVSVLLKPRLPAGEPLGLERYGWFSLIAGLAMTRTVDRLLPGAFVGVKWPNDVQVDGRKISGLLAELLPTADGVVLGAGVNLEMAADELPTPTSTSLSLAGARQRGPELVDEVLSSYLRELRALVTTFLRFGADAAGSGIRADVAERCSTIGQQVRVQLPGGDDLFGTAIDLDASGRLTVVRSSDGHSVSVAAGDVTHLRYE